jgi:hypothetical protein
MFVDFHAHVLILAIDAHKQKECAVGAKSTRLGLRKQRYGHMTLGFNRDGTLCFSASEGPNFDCNRKMLWCTSLQALDCQPLSPCRITHISAVMDRF